jgi:glycosyltransferase involved in cell wall biosynthesis
MDERALSHRTLVLSTGPVNFAGAGAAHAKTLGLLAAFGCEVHFWTPESPFRAKQMDAAGVRISVASVTSDAYPESDTVRYGSVAEAILHAATNWLCADASHQVVLLSTFLFPFCSYIERVAAMLRPFEGRVTCVLNPAGSDIWQIARQIPLIARQLMDSPHVSAIVTYSSRFAGEIKDIVRTKREIVVIPPAIDTTLFFPIDLDERAALRRSLGISASKFVLCHCSNHRPVKALQHVIEIAVALGTALDEDIHLLMVGPMTAHLRETLSQAGVALFGDALPGSARIGRVEISCVGLQQDVRSYHAISDVALNTSLHDSFNISLAEAMACEVPALTTSTAGIGTLVENGGGGSTFPFLYNPIYVDNAISLPGNSRIDVRGAVDWLISIRRDDVLRRAVGNAARRTIIQQCSDAVVGKRWFELLRLAD